MQEKTGIRPCLCESLETGLQSIAQRVPGVPGTSKRLVLKQEPGRGDSVQDARPDRHNIWRDLGQVVEGAEGDEAIGEGWQGRDRWRICITNLSSARTLGLHAG